MPHRTNAAARRLSDDPLTRAMAPPPDETESQRADRLRAEQEAKRISDLIDDELNRQRLAEKKGAKPVKILLLGQSESGKSTTLKNFQLMNSPKAFRAERASWRAVIQLNVVRSIRVILDAIAEAHAAAGGGPVPGSTRSSGSRSSTPDASPRTEHPPLTPEHLKLRMRLLPLLQVEAALAARLAPGAGARGTELAVGAGAAWKGAFARILARPGGDAHGDGGADADAGGGGDDPQDPGRLLHACGQDMIKLWNDRTIRELLRANKLRLEEYPGFFLDSLERVTSLQYVPTDNDILRARLKTLGVTEYRFDLKAAGKSVSHDWRIYDVGGQRSLVSAWVPFFDDMNAIIFLAPISCFDQVLVEDNSVNRLEDSVLLWKSIVANPLLAKSNLVLFLNKCDVLRAKLASGIRLGKYVISYGDRPNDFEHASEYLRKKFAGIHKDHSPEPRPFYCHLTSVTDTKTTAVILENVTDTVVRENLKQSSLI